MTASVAYRPAATDADHRSLPTLVAVAHGTRDPEGVRSTEQLVDRIRSLRPDLPVALCYLDIVSPALPELLASLSGDAVLVPLLLGAGYHVHVDIPEALAAAAGQLRATVARALGPDRALARLSRQRLTEAGHVPDDATGRPVVLAAAGSTDARANADTVRMAALLAAELGAPVVPSYLCAGSPTPAEAVAALRADGHEDVAVSGYLLSPGYFARKAARAGGSRTGQPLGSAEELARLVISRYEEAAARLRAGAGAGAGAGVGAGAGAEAGSASGAEHGSGGGTTAVPPRASSE